MQGHSIKRPYDEIKQKINELNYFMCPGCQYSCKTPKQFRKHLYKCEDVDCDCMENEIDELLLHGKCKESYYKAILKDNVIDAYYHEDPFNTYTQLKKYYLDHCVSHSYVVRDTNVSLQAYYTMQLLYILDIDAKTKIAKDALSFVNVKLPGISNHLQEI